MYFFCLWLDDDDDNPLVLPGGISYQDAQTIAKDVARSRSSTVIHLGTCFVHSQLLTRQKPAMLITLKYDEDYHPLVI